MHIPGVFNKFASLSAELKAMRDDCDKVAETLWAVAALLREADAGGPQPQRRLIPARRSNRVWAEMKIRSENRVRILNMRADVQSRAVR